MKTHETKLLKQQEVLGGTFDSKNYISERIWANSETENKIPISLVYHKTPKNLLKLRFDLWLRKLRTYCGCEFSNVRLSILDRGFIYAIAHIRGGEYSEENGMTTEKC